MSTPPDGLRAAGLSVVTIFEHYGVEESQSVADDVWLPEAAPGATHRLRPTSDVNGTLSGTGVAGRCRELAVDPPVSAEY